MKKIAAAIAAFYAKNHVAFLVIALAAGTVFTVLFFRGNQKWRQQKREANAQIQVLKQSVKERDKRLKRDSATLHDVRMLLETTKNDIILLDEKTIQSIPDLNFDERVRLLTEYTRKIDSLQKRN
jgi:hypothetical protein